MIQDRVSFTPGQLKLLKEFKKLGVKTFVNNSMLRNRARYEIREPDSKMLNISGWSVEYIDSWIDTWIFRSNYDETNNDRDILNSLRLHYIEYQKTHEPI